MKPEFDSLSLIDNTEKSRLEMEVDGQVAFIEYNNDEGKYSLLHTEVPESLEGKGVGAALVEKALTYLHKSKIGMIPYCPFVLAFLKRHPEWLEHWS